MWRVQLGYMFRLAIHLRNSFLPELVMKMLTFALAVVAGLQIASTGASVAQSPWREGYVEPRWNSRGSAVCPESYDYVYGWCRPREPYGYGRGYGHGRGRAGGEAIPPRWNSAGSAVCPNGYDYVREACRPRTAWRLPPRYNSAGSAVCPTGYDFRGGWCRPQY